MPKTQVPDQGTEALDAAVDAKRLKAGPVHMEMGKVAARVEPKGDGTKTALLPSSPNRMVTENRGAKGEMQRQEVARKLTGSALQIALQIALQNRVAIRTRGVQRTINRLLPKPTRPTSTKAAAIRARLSDRASRQEIVMQRITNNKRKDVTANLPQKVRAPASALAPAQVWAWDAVGEGGFTILAKTPKRILVSKRELMKLKPRTESIQTD